MRPVGTISGTMAPLPRINVDTDQIMPKQFLKRVERSGYGRYLFHDWARTTERRSRSGFRPQPHRVSATRRCW